MPFITSSQERCIGKKKIKKIIYCDIRGAFFLSDAVFSSVAFYFIFFCSSNLFMPQISYMPKQNTTIHMNHCSNILYHTWKMKILVYQTTHLKYQNTLFVIWFHRGLKPLPDEEVLQLYGGTYHVPLQQDSGFYGKVGRPPCLSGCLLLCQTSF